MVRIISFDIGERNLAYCLGDVRDRVIDVLEWVLRDVVGSRHPTVCESCDVLTSEILERLLSHQPDVVLIEQQVKPNVRAQRLMQHIWTWFKCVARVPTVLIVPSKLKYIDRRDVAAPEKNISYARRKKWAVETARALSTPDEWRLVDGLKKKDDVCDAYLQLVAYAEKNDYFRNPSPLNESV